MPLPAARWLPMFPLGNVLFPYGLLPLRIFEPRYLRMIDECSAGDHEFGVVLIERGSEVGGGEQRTTFGTRARILQTADLDGGQRAVVAAGLGRIKVVEWLPDDPYPQAMIIDVEEPPATGRAERTLEVERSLRRVLALHSELGLDVGDLSFHLDDDPMTASFQACSLAPLGPFDAQQLLVADDPIARLDRLDVLLAEQTEVLEQQLSQG